MISSPGMLLTATSEALEQPRGPMLMPVVPVATEGYREPCSLGCHVGIRCYSRAILPWVQCSLCRAFADIWGYSDIQEMAAVRDHDGVHGSTMVRLCLDVHGQYCHG